MMTFLGGWGGDDDVPCTCRESIMYLSQGFFAGVVLVIFRVCPGVLTLDRMRIHDSMSRSNSGGGL